MQQDLFRQYFIRLKKSIKKIWKFPVTKYISHLSLLIFTYCIFIFTLPLFQNYAIDYILYFEIMRTTGAFGASKETWHERRSFWLANRISVAKGGDRPSEAARMSRVIGPRPAVQSISAASRCWATTAAPPVLFTRQPSSPCVIMMFLRKAARPRSIAAAYWIRFTPHSASRHHERVPFNDQLLFWVTLYNFVPLQNFFSLNRTTAVA